MQTKSYLVDQDGNFRFTVNGHKEQAPLLAKAGIDAHSIKTYEQYLLARKAARPFFTEYLQEETEKQLNGKPNTLEWRAIRSIVFGSPEEQQELLRKVKLKSTLKLI